MRGGADEPIRDRFASLTEAAAKGSASAAPSRHSTGRAWRATASMPGLRSRPAIDHWADPRHGARVAALMPLVTRARSPAAVGAATHGRLRADIAGTNSGVDLGGLERRTGRGWSWRRCPTVGWQKAFVLDPCQRRE